MDMTRQKTVRWVVSALLVLAIAISFSGVLDRAGNQGYDSALKSALVTFGVVKALNGVISVAQGTVVSVSPWGLGVNIAAGEVLGPLNDLLERFSWVVLASSASLGIQIILLGISSWIGLKVLLAVAALFFGAAFWVPALGKVGSMNLLFKFLIVVFALRFFIPVVAMINMGVYGVFMEEQFNQSMASVSAESATLGESSLDTAMDSSQLESAEALQKDEQQKTLWDSVKGKWASAKNILNVKDNIAKLAGSAGKLTDNILKLIAVFLLQTILLPLFVLWALVKMAGWIFGFDSSRLIAGFSARVMENKASTNAEARG